MKINSLVLEQQNGHLQLRDTQQPRWQPIWIDWTTQDLNRRRVPHKIYSEFIVRAVGAKPHHALSVVDATAGFGEDGFLLACAGCSVTLLERSSIMFALLQDALDRARRYAELTEIIQRIQLICVDARDWLVSTEIKPDVIYLDPMFPERKKSALVKKDMRLLSQLVGTDDDAHLLLPLALRQASQRVVVKRPHDAPHLADLLPQGTIAGKRCRYEIYAPKNLSTSAERR